MAWDPDLGAFVVFGGVASGDYQYPIAATWEYGVFGGVATWQNLSPANSPPGGGGWSMAYDAAERVLVLAGFAGQTWTYSGADWSNITATAGGPSVQSGDCLTYDPQAGAVLLFGGESAGTQTFGNATWSFQNGTWTQLDTPSSPPASEGCELVDDPMMGAVVEFGGYEGSGAVPRASNETWLFQNGAWVDLPTPVEPPARADGSATYDPACGCIVLFGGANESGWTFGDTWVFESGNWYTFGTPNPPAPRYDESFAASPDGTAVLVGGENTNFDGVPDFTWNFRDPISVTLGARADFAADVGQPVDLVAAAEGGVGNLTFWWTGLPSGCASTGPKVTNCSASVAGLSNATVGAIDSDGLQGLTTFGRNISPAQSVTVRSSQRFADVGQSITLSANVTGGTGVTRVSWPSLVPGFGCTTVLYNLSGRSVQCEAESVGTYAITAFVNDSNGANVSSAPTPVVVSAPLTAGPLQLSSSSVAVGQSITFRPNAAGGSAPLEYSFEGLPPGCRAENVSSLTCTPTGTGTFEVLVHVSDASGAALNRSANLSVVAAPLASVLPWLVLGVGAVAAVAIAFVVLRARRRRPEAVRADGPP
jgi:hypothetical protein